MMLNTRRAFSGAPDSTFSYAGTFRMLWNLTIGFRKFWQRWNLYAGLQESSRAPESTAHTLWETKCQIVRVVDLGVPQRQGISNILFVFVTVPRFATSMIWHILSTSQNTVTHGDTGIIEIDSATASISLRKPRVHRHLYIIWNPHLIFWCSLSYALLLCFHRSSQCVWFLMNSCQPFINQKYLCASSWLGMQSYSLTLFLWTTSQNCSFPTIPFGCLARCGSVLMMGCPPSSSAISQQNDRVNWGMYSKAVIEQYWRSTWRRSIWRWLFGWEVWWELQIYLLVNLFCGNVGNWVQHGVPRNERLGGSGRQSILHDAFPGIGNTWCMLYSVYIILAVCCTWCMLNLVYAILRVCYTWWMLYSV